jgi:hypothetical protein
MPKHHVPKHVMLFQTFNAVVGIVTALFFFGLIQSQPTYFVVANTVVKTILAAWLVYRFKFVKNKVMSDFDQHASFVAGAYILVATFADSFQYFRLILQNKINTTFQINGLHEVPR